MRKVHSVVWKEDKLYVAKALEVEVVSQGKTQKEALDNLKEALELYFEVWAKKNWKNLLNNQSKFIDCNL